MCKFSVIVPVYKVEKVLPRCIESILLQTVTNFELILVDDGSPDRSGVICDEYAAQDPRIKVIHQKNGGVSRARNAGLEIAKGQYIVFVDSDDWVDADYLSSFEGYTSELVVCGQKVYGPDGAVETIVTSKEKLFPLFTESDTINFLRQRYAIQVWGKRFDYSIIKKSSLRFLDSVDYGEDAIFIAEYIKLISSVQTINKNAYNFQKTTSESLSKINDEQWFTAFAFVQEKIYRIFEGYKEIQQFLTNKICWVAENELVKISNSPWPWKKKVKAAEKVLRNSYFAESERNVDNSSASLVHLIFKTKSPHLAIWFYGRKNTEKS